MLWLSLAINGGVRLSKSKTNGLHQMAIYIQGRAQATASERMVACRRRPPDGPTHLSRGRGTPSGGFLGP